MKNLFDSRNNMFGEKVGVISFFFQSLWGRFWKMCVLVWAGQNFCELSVNKILVLTN